MFIFFVSAADPANRRRLLPATTKARFDFLFLSISLWKLGQLSFVLFFIIDRSVVDIGRRSQSTAAADARRGGQRPDAHYEEGE